MRLLDRYLLRELLLPLGYCLSGFLIFWVSFDLMSEMDDFQRNGLRASDMVAYYLARLPELLVVVLPVALLLALLYALSNHARHHEIVAMRAAGRSLWRLSLPYLGVGLVFTAVLGFLNEKLAPNGVETADRIRTRREKDAPGSEALKWRRPLNFRNDRDQRIWSIGAYNIETGEMLNPQVEWILPDGIRRHLIAARAEPAEEGWTFHEVVQLDFYPGQTTPPARLQTNLLAVAEFQETPALIKSEIKVSSLTVTRAAKRAQLSIAEIRHYLRLHSQLPPEKKALLLTQLHGRLAEPWTCLVVVLVALPFGAASGRRNVFAGVASSIFICFTYFVLQKFGLALGTGGYVPPWLAAWFPNLFFGGLGIWLTQRAR